MLEDNNLGKFKERRNKTVKPYERPKVRPGWSNEANFQLRKYLNQFCFLNI